MEPEPIQSPRPYWYKDAKWISGLLLTALLGLTIFIFSLVTITDEKIAIDTVSTGLALVFSRNGLDDETEIAQTLYVIRSSPDKSFSPIPGLRISVREKDIDGLSPRAMRIYFFRQLAEPLYWFGPEVLVNLADNPQMVKDTAVGIEPLSFFSAGTHRALQMLLLILGVSSFVLVLPLVFFSQRFGRLGSPGVALFFASLPGTVVFTIAYIAVSQISPNTLPDEKGGIVPMLGYVAANLAPTVLQVFFRDYLLFLLLGLAITTLAVFMEFSWWIIRKLKSS